jgi:hypothetical protein
MPSEITAPSEGLVAAFAAELSLPVDDANVVILELRRTGRAVNLVHLLRIDPRRPFH